jgi:hypothetical protein
LNTLQTENGIFDIKKDFYNKEYYKKIPEEFETLKEYYKHLPEKYNDLYND